MWVQQCQLLHGGWCILLFHSCIHIRFCCWLLSNQCRISACRWSVVISCLVACLMQDVLVRKPLTISFSPDGENFLFDPYSMVLSGCQVCNWGIQYHLRITYRGLWELVVVWLSGCCSSAAEHWRLKPEVSCIGFPRQLPTLILSGVGSLLCIRCRTVFWAFNSYTRLKLCIHSWWRLSS